MTEPWDVCLWACCASLYPVRLWCGLCFYWIIFPLAVLLAIDKGSRQYVYVLYVGTIRICSVTKSCPTLWPHGLPHARLPCPSLSPGACSNSCPLSWWCHPTMSSSVAPSCPALNLSQHQSLCWWVDFLHQVAKVLEFQLQHQSFQWILMVNFL